MPPVVLFLDFDGVLNGEAFLRRQRNHGQSRLFSPINMSALEQLCVRVPVTSIVVTSTWRIGRSLEVLRELLTGEGFDHGELVISATPDLGDRTLEIEKWIADHGQAIHPLILDDCQLRFSDGFFRTDAWEGLTLDMVDRIVSSFQSS